MPYIDKELRKIYSRSISTIARKLSEMPGFLGGDFNYVITKIMDEYVELRGEKYHRYNELIGALECAKMEMYRRKIALYEDKAIKKNGDL